MSKDETRKAILARRARFVAAAMVGLGVAACEKQGAPNACLSTAPTARPEDTAPSTSARPEDTTPVPCLSVAVDPNFDAGAQPETSPMPCLSKPPPQVCLSPMPPPTAQPCLKVAPPTH